jgi:hypothetical protein
VLLGHRHGQHDGRRDGRRPREQAQGPAPRHRRIVGRLRGLDESGSRELRQRVIDRGPSVFARSRLLDALDEGVQRNRLGANLPHQRCHLIQRMDSPVRLVEHGGRPVGEPFDDEAMWRWLADDGFRHAGFFLLGTAEAARYPRDALARDRRLP